MPYAPDVPQMPWEVIPPYPSNAPGPPGPEGGPGPEGPPGPEGELPGGPTNDLLVANLEGKGKFVEGPDINVKVWGAKGDGLTNDTKAISEALVVAEEKHGNLKFPPGIYLVEAGKLTLKSGGVSVSGSAKGGSTLKATAGEGYILTLKPEVGKPYITENHAVYNSVRDLLFDGNGRSLPIGGLNLEQQQSCVIENIQSNNFLRQAVRFHSFRESVVHNCYGRFSGTAYQYPQIHIDDNGEPEGCNNVYFIGLRSLYHAGNGLQINGNSGGASKGSTRLLFFFGSMVHGAAIPFPFETPEGYKYENEAEFSQSVYGVLVKDARSIFFDGIRCNAWGRGAAAFRVAEGEAGAASVNLITVRGNSNGTPNKYEELTVAVAPATDIISAEKLRLGTGSIVTISSTGEIPAGLAANTEYFAIRVNDNEIKLASTYAKALAGEPINITTAGSGVIKIIPRWILSETEKGTIKWEKGEETASTDPRAEPFVNRTAEKDNLTGFETIGSNKFYSTKLEQNPIQALLVGEAQPRFKVDSFGAIWFGTGGANAPERFLYSPAKEVLRTDAPTFTITGSLVSSNQFHSTGNIFLTGKFNNKEIPKSVPKTAEGIWNFLNEIGLVKE